MNISFNSVQNSCGLGFTSQRKSPEKNTDKSPRADLFVSSDKFDEYSSSKGLYGQNLHDELSELNKLDPGSIYYEPNRVGLYYDPEAVADGKGWYAY